MSNSNPSGNSPAAKDTLNRYKMEVSREFNIDLSAGPNLTTAQAGRVDGQMVKRMIEKAKNS